MIRRWLAYLLLLAGMLLFFVFYWAWFSWYALTVLLLLPPLDLLGSLPGLFGKRVSLSAPPVFEQRAEGRALFTVQAKNPFPSGRVTGRITVTGQDMPIKRRISFFGKQGSVLLPPAATAHSGLISLRVTRLWRESVLGFFAVPTRLNAAAVALVLPKPVPPRLLPAPPKPAPLRPKRGGGSAEEHDIRPYQPGDPISGIHWKLSAKYDSLMLREPLERPPQSRLISCAQWQNRRERDLILGRLRWLSGYLTERGFPHYIRLGTLGPAAQVNRADDLHDYLRRLLSDAPPVPERNLPVRFTCVYYVDAKEGTP